MARRKPPAVFIVSDGRGETALQLVTAAAVQFRGVRYATVRKPNVRTQEQIRRIVEKAAESDAVIFYTLVSEDIRKAIRKCSRDLHVPTIDVLGPAFTALHDLFQRDRGSVPGLLYEQERERFDRMDAIDYTLKHDDGQRPHELASANVVLVGVSRASKSTTCFYLASEGVRAANVPLFADIPPPRQLLRLPRRKVISLRINANRLLTVREGRARNLGLGQHDPYTDKRSVEQELAAVNRLIEGQGWRGIDASYLAIEEIAREVMHLIRTP